MRQTDGRIHRGRGHEKTKAKIGETWPQAQCWGREGWERQEGSSLELLEAAKPCRHLDFRLWPPEQRENPVPAGGQPPWRFVLWPQRMNMVSRLSLRRGLGTAAATQGLSGPGPPWQDPGRLGICSDMKRLHVNIPE